MVSFLWLVCLGAESTLVTETRTLDVLFNFLSADAKENYQHEHATKYILHLNSKELAYCEYLDLLPRYNFADRGKQVSYYTDYLCALLFRRRIQFPAVLFGRGNI
jgi:hypothetical protein